MPFDPGRIGDDLDAYFAAREAQYKDIKPGTEKRVIWAGAPPVPARIGSLSTFTASRPHPRKSALFPTGSRQPSGQI